MATVARTPDATLLRRLRERDRTAWEELYVEYEPRLRGFGLRLAGKPHDADDLVQEKFVRALPRLDRLDPDTTDVAAYLFATMRNLFLKQVERGGRQQPVAEVPEPDLPTPIEDDPERGALLRSQQDDVRLANARLQPRQRLVLALRELEDRSYAEIGELVDMKENAVAQLIFRARESLRTEMRLAQVEPDRFPEECRAFLPLLAAHLDGQLKGPRLERTLEHLEGCERCQSALADMKEASRRYRTLFPLVMGSDDARAAIDRRLDDAGYWRATRRRRFVRRSAGIGAVVVGALVLGGGATAVGVRLSRDARPAAASQPVSTAPAVVPPDDAGASQAVETATVAEAPVKTQPTAKKAPPPKPPASKEPPPTVSNSAPPPPTTNEEPAAAPKAPPKPKLQPKPQTTPTPKPPAAKPPKSVPPPPDTTAPAVAITSAPPGTVAVASVEIRFVASEHAVTFACKLDAAAYAPCASPAKLSGLGAGSHTFAVRATDKAGNVGKPATVTWTYVPLDTTPPTVGFTSAPPASTIETTAMFQFQSSEPATFECSLDGAGFATCTSPASTPTLALGRHTFSVRATDEAGNTSATATHSWTVVAPLPDLYVSAFTKFSITVSNKGQAAATRRSTLTVTLIGTFTVPALPPGASATFSWSICRVGTYTAIVDRTNVVVESDEQNNTASRANTCP
jgi:RNA polymerase sigma factor (sigma-70 family)